MKTFTTTVAVALLASVALAQTPVAPATSCVIHTPQQALMQGKTYEITYEGCTGNSPIFLRYGDPLNLATDKKPACESVDLSQGSCRFTPVKGSHDEAYTFSTMDQNGESFSGEFKIAPKSNKGKKADTQQHSKKTARALAMRRKRSLYDIHSFGIL
ncbi:hypothetical protein DFQ26_005471 [Actinomortierella ambigua]|nr:hypothetical protein DFQ26_005471 [Actinomortierella ambigua]